MIIRDLPENSNNQKNGCFVAVLIETKVLLQFASISILRVTTDQINANGPSLSYRTEESKIPETAQVKINGSIAKQKSGP